MKCAAVLPAVLTHLDGVTSKQMAILSDMHARMRVHALSLGPLLGSVCQSDGLTAPGEAAARKLAGARICQCMPLPTSACVDAPLATCTMHHMERLRTE